jgi:hypothetical protein
VVCSDFVARGLNSGESLGCDAWDKNTASCGQVSQAALVANPGLQIYHQSLQPWCSLYKRGASTRLAPRGVVQLEKCQALDRSACLAMAFETRSGDAPRHPLALLLLSLPRLCLSGGQPSTGSSLASNCDIAPP